MDIKLRQIIKAAVDTVPVNLGWPKAGQTMPHVSAFPSDLNPEYKTDGANKYRKTGFQIDIWCASYAEMVTLRDKLRSAFDGVRYDREPIDVIFIETERYSPSNDPAGSYHRYSIDIAVRHVS